MPKRTFTLLSSSVLTFFSGAAMVAASGCARSQDLSGSGTGPQSFGDHDGGEPFMGGGNGGAAPVGPNCGNGRVDDGEPCDGSELMGQTCASATLNAKPDGQLRCTGCVLDTSACTGGSGVAGGTGGPIGAGGGIGEWMDGGGQVGSGGDTGSVGDTGNGGTFSAGVAASVG